MISQILRFALRQRFIVLVRSLALIGVGIWAFEQLKIEAYPDISDTQVEIITTYPGPRRRGDGAADHDSY